MLSLFVLAVMLWNEVLHSTVDITFNSVGENE
jgi:hypothetical protein